MNDLKDVLKRNENWAKAAVERDPEFFDRLVGQQSPKFLWIGCSDSRVPANEIVAMDPGELFVHRNVANVVANSDANCQSVIQFAVEHLKVNHIMVVGHYGCGGVQAALNRTVSTGISDYWLGHVRDVADAHRDLIKAERKADDKASLLAELNVMEQALNVCTSAAVLDAWAHGHDLTVHAWIYPLTDGILRRLDINIDAPCDVGKVRRRTVDKLLKARAKSPKPKRGAITL